jgi:hypothetical protein
MRVFKIAMNCKWFLLGLVEKVNNQTSDSWWMAGMNSPGISEVIASVDNIQ